MKSEERELKDNSYEIYEYDNASQEFSRSIGSAHGRTRKEACLNFQEENDWTSDGDKILFAKPPICR